MNEKNSPLPPLDTTKPYVHVDHITEKHIDRYLELFTADPSSAMVLAIGQCGIMTWPDAPDDWRGDETDEQIEFQEDEDEILDRALRYAEPALREAFRRAAEEVLGIRRHPTESGALPKYERSSWDLVSVHPERDMTDDELAACEDRARRNMRWFLRYPREEYTLQEAAELLALRPDDVPAAMAEEFRCGKLGNGPYPRREILVLALERCAWESTTFADETASVGRDLRAAEEVLGIGAQS